MPRPGAGRTRQTEAGAAAVEFAIVALLFFSLIFGVLQFGVYIWRHQAVSAAAREAARYGMATGVGAGTPQFVDCAGIRAAARQFAPELSMADSEIAIRWEKADGTPKVKAGVQLACTGATGPAITDLDDGDAIVVAINKPLDVFVPLVGGAFEGKVIQVTERRTIHPKGTAG
jgi:Flp pilus assembly protein TadG